MPWEFDPLRFRMKKQNPEVKITKIEIDPLQQATCDHEWSADMFYLFQGTVGQICTKCHKRGPTRPMTQEEADSIDLENF